MKAVAVLIFALFSLALQAQELNCQVEVVAPSAQSTDPQVFKDLENAINQFMNNRKWTSDVFKVEERIECSILINITQEGGGGQFKGTATIQSSRPVFNSGYNTVMFNYVDKGFEFQYAQFQQMNYSDNVYNNNLTSLLAFYAYVIIALDYESFAPEGGETYLQKAQTVMNSIPPSADAPGWKPFDGNNNRYWIIENMLNAQFKPFRETLYQYHRKGLDQMYEDPAKGRTQIYEALKKIETVAQQNPNATIFNIFFQAKGDEIVKIFKGGSPKEKSDALQLMYKIDAGNSQKYAKILK